MIDLDHHSKYRWDKQDVLVRALLEKKFFYPFYSYSIYFFLEVLYCNNRKPDPNLANC